MSDYSMLPENSTPVRDLNYDPYLDPTSVFYGLIRDFEPTEKEPLQRLRCSFVKRNGIECTSPAVMGTGYLGTRPLCRNHGGNEKRLKQRAEEITNAARMMLTRSVPNALETLVRLSTDPDVAENVQLAAVKDILDRAGLKAGEKLDVTVEHNVSPSQRIGDKLAELRGSKAELEDLGEKEEEN